MLLYSLRGGWGCQKPSNDIYGSPGLASHPGLTVTALLRSTVNRRNNIDSMYSNAIPCHPASERCDPLSTEGKKIDNLYCNAIRCHPASQRCDPLSTEGKKNQQSVLQSDSLSSCNPNHDL